MNEILDHEEDKAEPNFGKKSAKLLGIAVLLFAFPIIIMAININNGLAENDAVDMIAGLMMLISFGVSIWGMILAIKSFSQKVNNKTLAWVGLIGNTLIVVLFGFLFYSVISDMKLLF